MVQQVIRFESLGQSRFVILLAALMAVLVASPFASGTAERPGILDVPLAAVLLGGIFAVSGRAHVFAFGALLAVPAIALRVLSAVVLGEGAALAGAVLGASFMLYTSIVVLWFVLHDLYVTIDTIAGAACVYLLIGLVFAVAFGLLERFSLGSFTGLEAAEQPGIRDFSQLIYFSYVTVTTLGYGDIVPVGRGVRALAAGEAILGQLYLAILVARLIGLHISTAARESA
jgi:hypothetical protein